MAEDPEKSKDLSIIIDKAAASLGYARLKQEQKKALYAFISGIDVFVSIPTGYGKLLCYALLPFIFDVKRGLVEKKSIAMIVSPLIALMNIQPGSFTRKSITNSVDVMMCLIIELHQNHSLYTCSPDPSFPQTGGCRLRD